MVDKLNAIADGSLEVGPPAPGKTLQVWHEFSSLSNSCVNQEEDANNPYETSPGWLLTKADAFTNMPTASLLQEVARPKPKLTAKIGLDWVNDSEMFVQLATK